jgi:DNA-binding MarR family transcriptional regulator
MQINSASDFRVVVRRDELASAGDGGSGGEPFVVEESVGYLVNYLAKALARALAERLAAHGAHLGQWGVLMFLWARDGQSQGELSRQVAIEDATMVRTIDRMERDGLVRRERDAQDRRRVNIFLTERGLALQDSLIPCAVAVNETATQPFTESEREQLSGLLRRMIEALEGAPRTRGKGGDHVRVEGIE